MKHRILSLLTMMLFVVGGAWAQDVLLGTFENGNTSIDGVGTLTVTGTTWDGYSWYFSGNPGSITFTPAEGVTVTKMDASDDVITSAPWTINFDGYSESVTAVKVYGSLAPVVDPNAVDVTLKPYAKGDNQTYTATMALPEDGKGLKITVEYEKIPDVVSLPDAEDNGPQYEVTLDGEALASLGIEPADLEDADLQLNIIPEDGKKMTALEDANITEGTADIAFDWNTQDERYEAELTVAGSPIAVAPTYADLLTKTINTTQGWATFVPQDANYDAPATGLYTVSDASATAVTAKPLAADQTVVAKQTPLLVSAAEALTLTESRATKAADIPSATIEGNKLLAGDGETEYALAQNAYGLYNGEFVLFEGIVPEGKAYLVMPTAAASRLAIVFEGETTGISLTPSPSPMGEGSIYSLSGQKLSKLQKGVNIINGKKVIIK